MADAAPSWVGDLRELGPCEVTLAYIRHAPAHASEHVPEEEEILEDERMRALRVLGEEPAAIRIGAGTGRVDSQRPHLAAEVGAELIVVGTHQWHGLDRLRHRSVSRHILRDPHINVACVPPASADRQ